MNRHVLVIGGRDSSLNRLPRGEMEITLLQTRTLLTPQQCEIADRVVVADLGDEAAVLSLAAALHAWRPFDAVASFYEAHLLVAARIAEALGIAGNPLRPVELTRDKLRMRQVLANSGLPTVRFARCDDLAALRMFFREVGGSIILKPSMGSGSTGVSMVTDETGLEAAWAWADAAGAGSLIAEEYVEGPEYSIESLSLGGCHRILGITEKLTSGAPHFIELGHQFPAPLAATAAARIERTVLDFLELIGQQTGPAHTEVRLRDGTPVIIESQTRFGGDQIWEMVELVCGVNQAAATVCHLLGLPAPAFAPRFGGVAIRFLVPPAGTVVALHGDDEARHLDDVIRVELKCKSGDRIGALRNSFSRSGYVLAGGPTPAAASRTAERAAAMISFG